MYILRIIIALFLLKVSAWGQINYPDFSSVAGLNMVGSTRHINNRLRLTPDTVQHLGTAWYQTKQYVQNGFQTRFQFQITDTAYSSDATYPTGGDGISFTIQNDNATILGDQIVGIYDMGYAGITNSVSVEFDMYYNPGRGDPDGNHVSIHTNGTGQNSDLESYSIGKATPKFSMHDGKIHTVKIDYDVVPGKLRVFIDDTMNALLSVPLDLTNINGGNILDSGTAWVGFTGGTGAAFENQDILNWTFYPLVLANAIAANILGFTPLTCDSVENFLVSIRDTGNLPLQVDSVFITQDSEGFSIYPPLVFPFTVDPGQSIPVTIRFAPINAGMKTAVLVVNSDASNASVLLLDLSGEKDSIKLSVNHPSVNFGKLSVCGHDSSIVLTVTNVGNVPALSGNITIEGAPIFSLTGNSAISLDTGRFAKIGIVFSPTSDSSYTGDLVIHFQCDSLLIPLSGSGVVPRIMMTNADFGLVCTGDSAVEYVTLQNPSDTSIVITAESVPSPFAIDSPAVPFTISAKGSVIIRAKFVPNGNGAFSQQIKLTGAPCAIATAIFTGEQHAPSIAAANLDFGSVCSADSIIRYIDVSNPGDTDLTITSASVQMPFRVDSPTVPFVIPKNGSMQVRAIFMPSSDGQYSQLIRLNGEPCDVSATFTLSGVHGTPALRVTDADFGSICIGDTEEKTIVLHNTGNASVTISTINNPQDFRIITQLPITIAPGDSAQVAIAFSPTTTNSFADTVVISGTPCAVMVLAHVRGVGISVAFQSSDVNFKTIQVDNLEIDTIVIKNTGTVSVNIQLQTSVPFSVDSSNVTIEAGDSVKVGVHYLPSQVGSDSAVLCLTTNTFCPYSVCYMLRGQSTDIVIPTVELCSVSPEAILPMTFIHMPVVLLNSIANTVDSISFEIKYDPTALLYIGINSSQCQANIQRNGLGVLLVNLSVCGEPLTGGETLCDLNFSTLVTSKDTTFTDVSIDSITFYPASAAQGSGCSVSVTINPACGLTGVIYSGLSLLSQNYPNPFSGTTAIHVMLSQSDMGNAKLKVYNIFGNEVADLSWQLEAEGDVIFKADEFPSGVYYYVLETDNGRLMRQMFLVK